MSALIDPDCVAGKHAPMCLGNAWDNDNDMPVDCACPCHRDAAPTVQQDGSTK